MSVPSNDEEEYNAAGDEIYRALEWIRERRGLNYPQIYLIGMHVLETSIAPKIKVDLKATKAARK